MKILQRLWKDESGQGLVEYGLLIVLIVVIAVAALTVFGDSIKDLFGGIDAKVNDASDTISAP